MHEANPEELRHGDLRADGSARWCEVHSHFHGPTSSCPHYTRRTLREIQRQRMENRASIVELLRAGDQSFPVIASAVTLGLLPKGLLPPADDAINVLGDLDDDR